MSNTRHATGVPGGPQAIGRALAVRAMMLEFAAQGDTTSLAQLAESYADDPVTLGSVACLLAQDLATAQRPVAELLKTFANYASQGEPRGQQE